MPITDVRDIDDETRRLTLSTEDVVELRVEDDGVCICANGTEIDRLSFRCYETPISPHEDRTICRLTHAFIEGEGGRYQGHGVGTHAVKFYLDCTGYDLELPENDGIQKDDGSHLVGSGPGFVASLKRKQARGEL
jgi:hypothetical protein